MMQWPRLADEVAAAMSPTVVKLDVENISSLDVSSAGAIEAALCECNYSATVLHLRLKILLPRNPLRDCSSHFLNPPPNMFGWCK